MNKEELIKKIEKRFCAEYKIVNGEHHFICGDVTRLIFTNKNLLKTWCVNWGDERGGYYQISFPTLQPIYLFLEMLSNEEK